VFVSHQSDQNTLPHGHQSGSSSGVWSNDRVAFSNGSLAAPGGLIGFVNPHHRRQRLQGTSSIQHGLPKDVCRPPIAILRLPLVLSCKCHNVPSLNFRPRVNTLGTEKSSKDGDA
jgi:hypothetical protein